MQVRFDSGSAFNCLEFDELVFGVSGRCGVQLQRFKMYNKFEG